MKKIILFIMIFLLPSFLMATSDTLKITGDKDYAPYSYLDEHNKAKGLLIDIWKEYALVTGSKIEFLLLDRDDSVKAIQDGRAVVYSGLYDLPKNSYKIGTINSTEGSFFAKKDYDEEIRNQKVGVIGESFAKKIQSDFADIKIVKYANYDEMFKALDDGKIELFFDSKDVVLELTNKTELDVAISFLSHTSSLIHSLQQERGASSGYVSSKAKLFSQKLQDTKYHTNKKIKSLQNMLRNEKSLKIYFSKDEYKAFDEALKELYEARKSIKNLNIGFSKTYSTYTKLISALLLNISEIGDKVKNKKLSSEIYNYSTILMHKESIGQKRASLSALFSKENFSKEIFEYFLTSNIQEKIYLKSFLHSSSDKVQKLYADTLNTKEYKKVSLYEKLALKKLRGESVDVNPEDWFVNATKKIDKIQEIEHFVFKDILNSLKDMKRDKEKNIILNNRYEIIETDKQYFFDMISVAMNKEIAKELSSGFKKIGQKRLKEIESSWASSSKDSINNSLLTPSELSWIKSNTISVGVEQWTPVIFSNDGTDIDGIAGDFTKLLIEKTGLKIKIINDDWNKLLNDFKQKKIDLLPATYFTDERATYGLYSNGYFKMKDSIFVKDDNKKITSLKDLNGKTLAIPKGYGTIAKLQKEFPDIKLIFTKDLDDSINRVLSGRVDAFYEGQIAAKHKIDEELIKGIKSVNVNSFKAPSLFYFSKIEEPILLSIINKGLKSITREEKNKIIKKWTSGNSIELNEAELLWLEKGEAVKYVFDPEWKPFEWADEVGEHTGINYDILNLIGQKSGMRFKAIKSKTWTQATQKVIDNKAVMYSGVGATDERQEYMKFTNEPIFSSPYVFVSKGEDLYMDGFKDIGGKKIACIGNSTISGILKKEMPGFKPIYLDSNKEGFQKIRSGELDVLILNVSAAKYFINMAGFKDVKISYKTPFLLELKIGIRKDVSPEVLSIINKSIDTISRKELDDIYTKWTTRTEGEKYIDWVLVSEIAGVVLLLILFILYNNNKLKRLVRDKTFALEELLESLEIKVKERTKDLDASKKEVEAVHKHTRESIEYAALIQGALIPEHGILSHYFKDNFVHWLPKDTVGGDIWLFNRLRHKDECLLFFIDCTGHGVPGAFVTMIVKAVEREVVGKILKDEKIDVSPAWIMAYFNKTMKVLLKQTTKDAESNAGWDGGVIYYNRRTQVLKFAGAETPLFYIDEDGAMKTIKGNRYSVGYKKCELDHKYKESILDVKEGMKFYCTTDGYLDQNGGEKSFPFGKKRFTNIVKEHHSKVMSNQKDIFLKEMYHYESMIENNDRNDDMTVIAFEIGETAYPADVILEYNGILTQGIISHSMDILENNIGNDAMTGKVSTVVVELLQNMMNYSKSHDINSKDLRAAGFIEVLKDIEDIYYVTSRNILSLEDKQKIEPVLIQIHSMDINDIKKRYRELRRSGKDMHDKGAGIGFYEISKSVQTMTYKFTKINDEKFIFEFKVSIASKNKLREK